MKKYISSFVFFFMLFGALNLSAQQQMKATVLPSVSSENPVYVDLNVEEFKAKMSEKDVVILDVRTPGETAQGKIEGAVEINFRDPSFAKRVQDLDKNKKYLVYCRSGRRSLGAIEIMVENGFKDLYNLVGGYNAWKK